MAFDDILARRPQHTDRGPLTATVTKNGNDGAYVTPLDEDSRYPIGPCRGTSSDLPVGAVVLIVFTAAGPWIAATEGGGS